MKNFDWTKFTKKILIKSDVKTVYDAWTKSEELEKWFLSKAKFTTPNNQTIPASENAKAGNSYEWNWYVQDSHEEGKVISANGHDCFEFSFAGNCKVQINLKNIKNQVSVELVQSDIPLDDNAKENIRLGCAFGWTFYLINLKSTLEGGLDLRNKDSEITGLVNN
ncbi:MAG: SRPBCC domain-containing protein [Bacteroidia bacterium]|nr:SRPBCC domain-containing protein [Bacteroidia bacterium]